MISSLCCQIELCEISQQLFVVIFPTAGVFLKMTSRFQSFQKTTIVFWFWLPPASLRTCSSFTVGLTSWIISDIRLKLSIGDYFAIFLFCLISSFYFIFFNELTVFYLLQILLNILLFSVLNVIKRHLLLNT